MQRCRHSIEAFGRTYFPEMMAEKTPDWHLELDELVECLYQDDNDKMGLIVAAPRGHGKTARLSQLHTLHALLYGRERFIILISATDDNAKDALKPLKLALETNELLRADFGDLVGSSYFPAQTWNDNNLTLCWPSDSVHKGVRSERPGIEKTSAIIARGVESKLRGLRHGAFRPSLIILDDAESEENVTTEHQRSEILKWLYAEAAPMLDPRHGKLIVVGTVLHFDSLLAKLLKREDVYHTRIYRALKEDGTPLWPDMFPLTKLEQIRTERGSRYFAQEYMNNPAAEGERVFRPEWFRPYTSDEVFFDDGRHCWIWRDQPLRVFQGIDPAISEKQRADDFARITIGVTQAADIIVLEALGCHLDFPAQLKAVEQGYLDWAPERIGIEEVGFQRALRQQLLRERFLPLKALNVGPLTAKSTRIIEMDTHFEAGKVYIRKALPDEAGSPDFSGTLPWRIHHSMVRFFEQAVQYPDGAHDDLLDAMQLALQAAGLIRRAGTRALWAKSEEA